MENKLRHIWIVETKYYDQHPQSNFRSNESQHDSYFSSKEKALIHTEWEKACAEKNGMAMVYSEDAYCRYRDPNGHTMSILTIKVPLDIDDLFIGEA